MTRSRSSEVPPFSGTGSLGLDRYRVLLEGWDADPGSCVVLEFKQARPYVVAESIDLTVGESSGTTIEPAA